MIGLRLAMTQPYSILHVSMTTTPKCPDQSIHPRSTLILATDRAFFFIRKMLISFLYLHENMWYSLEAPRQGASNEYPQYMFSWRNKKNIMWIPPLICSYAYLYIYVSAGSTLFAQVLALVCRADRVKGTGHTWWNFCHPLQKRQLLWLPLSHKPHHENMPI